ncbi:Prp18 domain-containing protein [Polychytrium aggregatum]|uniref:Prp18 domain-containing protein n=1 Tax=Polychytrium aggregatum TaxID=110093 RepID=UPI0022FEA130|nr:Prp18 domain-containing protein [Polychytrium aggregatum]KAI9197276.1 Prp18 domain-containing protein [Polychytrium aggregatum]
MDFLKAELERKRKAIETVLDKSAAPTTASGSKYIKRSELERLREQKYLEDQRKLEEERNRKRSRANPDDGESQISAQTASTDKAKGPANDDEDTLDISVEDVIRRFRSRGQPIRLFGESDKDRIKRLRALESVEEQTEGQRNDFKKAIEQASTGLELEHLKRQAGITDEPDREPDEFLDYDTTIVSPELLQSDPDLTYRLLGIYFRMLLKEWEKYLKERPDEVRRTNEGKLQSATQAQSAEYMKPFFKGLKKRTVPHDVVAHLAEICKLLQQREYLQANDAYLRMSIGNSPWPIGVTMVGIHERSAREKIFSSQVAHVLNDETQRKWIQAIKRLMTFAQTKWPPSDLAKLVG